MDGKRTDISTCKKIDPALWDKEAGIIIAVK
jgi:hypothetical protein